MKLSIFLLTLFSGFMGTLVMTIVMYLYALLSRKNTYVVHILGLMVTGTKGINYENQTRVLTTGSIVHISVGILFSLGYYLLWNWGVFKIQVLDSIIVGAVSGILAIIVWRSYLNIYESPPKVPLLHYSISLFFSHIIFGLVTVRVFKLLAVDPQFWYQL